MSSDQEESNVNSDEQESGSGSQQGSDQDQESGSGQDSGSEQDSEQGSEQESGSGQDDDEDDEDNDGEEQEDASDSNDTVEETQKKLPTFKMVNRQPPEQFKFASLLDEISSLGNSVDSFISTLHSAPPEQQYKSYKINNNYATDTYKHRRLDQLEYTAQVPVDLSTQSRVVMVKDEDTQVDMKPQIVIQPTKPVKQQAVVQAKPYRVSNESERFLAQLYDENKKLKRWQNGGGTNTASVMNGYNTSMSNGSVTGANRHFFNSQSQGFGAGSREKFERKEYQKGLFNVEERNKEIDQAIHMLRRQEEDDY